MLAEYSGYCGMGTRMPSRSSRMIAFRMKRTAGEAPSVRKMFCAGTAGEQSPLNIC
jgi:hypothetical protein